MAQNSFYVAPNGNDSNVGSETAPWRSFQKAATTATAGSTVYLKAGTYNEKVVMGVSGTINNYITFRNYDSDNVVLDGTAVAGTILLKIHNKSYIRIQGIHLTNCIANDCQGILIDGTSHHIEIVDNKISNIHFSANPNAVANPNTNSQPLIVYGTSSTAISDLLIAGNEIYNNRTGYSEALAINGNVNGFVVRNNVVHDNTNIGIDIIGHENTCPIDSLDQARNGQIRYNKVWKCSSPYAAAAGIYVDGGKNLQIENNEIARCQYGIEIGCENVGKNTSNIIVRNNILYRNAISCLALGGYDYPNGSGKVINSLFYNNTCFQNDTANTYTGELYLSYSENSQILNNILYATNQKVFITKEFNSPQLNIDYNLYYFSANTPNQAEFSWSGNDIVGFANYQNTTNNDAHAIFVNPNFVNTSLADFHLLCSSPAIDAGNNTNQAEELDMDLGIRIINGIVDIGADESVANGFVPNIIGNTIICSGNNTITYSTNNLAGATYSWTVTNGTIISGQGTPIIQVVWNDANNAGTVQVVVEVQ
ncbi:MAG TPA: right-handed parallel beta-helix repeat-containing protein [Chitinophagales bacterium]|nr:right-handed parallel beta-helix repeat-containing protein [Chitinophagales bacterium]